MMVAGILMMISGAVIHRPHQIFAPGIKNSERFLPPLMGDQITARQIISAILMFGGMILICL